MILLESLRTGTYLCLIPEICFSSTWILLSKISISCLLIDVIRLFFSNWCSSLLCFTLPATRSQPAITVLAKSAKRFSSYRPGLFWLRLKGLTSALVPFPIFDFPISFNRSLRYFWGTWSFSCSDGVLVWTLCIYKQISAVKIRIKIYFTH